MKENGKLLRLESKYTHALHKLNNYSDHQVLVKSGDWVGLFDGISRNMIIWVSKTHQKIPASQQTSKDPDHFQTDKRSHT